MPKTRSQCRRDKEKAEISASEHSNDDSDIDMEDSSSSDHSSDLEFIDKRKYKKLKHQMNQYIKKKEIRFEIEKI